VRPREGRGPPVRIALVGLLTSKTPEVSTGPFGLAEFRNEEKTLQALGPSLEHDADVVVLLTHCGLQRDIELAQRFPNVALILGGHSHTFLRRPVTEGRTMIVQSGSRGAALTELEVTVESDPPRLNFLHHRFVDMDFEGAAAPETQRFLDATFGHIGPVWDQPIGEVEGGEDSRKRAGSTPSGNLIAGLIRVAAGADIGLTNKGGIRSSLQTGPITRRQVFELLPFENTVVAFDLTGEELREVLRVGLETGRSPMEIDGGTYSYSVVQGQRVLRDVLVAGSPLQPEQAYRVATNSFVAQGGDGHRLLAAKEPVFEGGKLLRDLLLERLKETGKVLLDDDKRILSVN